MVPEPEVPNPQEVDGFFERLKLSIAEVGTTFVKSSDSGLLHLPDRISPLLRRHQHRERHRASLPDFGDAHQHDGDHRARACLEHRRDSIHHPVRSHLRSDRRQALIVVLVTYSMVAFTAAGFAPLVLEEMSDAVDGSSEAYLANQKEAYRYDLVLEWYDATTAGAIEDQRRYTNLWEEGYTPTEGTYVLSSLHGRPMISDGTNKWVAPVGERIVP